MGRKMSLRGRPGILFLGIVVVFLIIFLLSWKSIKTTKEKANVKDIYSMHMENLRKNDRANLDQSGFNDVWNRAKISDLNGNLDSEKDLQYRINNLAKPDLGKEANNIKIENFNPISSKSGNVESPLRDHLHPKEKPSIKAEDCKPAKDQKPFYKEPDPSFQSISNTLQRLVHLDLKGAAPKVSYFKTLFPLLNKLGANGLLIEYEDMFPFSGSLKDVAASNAYTEKDIQELLANAASNKLSVIPLLQTFGHMEFVLKSPQFINIRESEYTPQVISVTSNSSYSVIRTMVKQILDAHPSAAYLHIGCDEVYELGRGKSSNLMTSQKLTTEHMFLRHVTRVAGIVTELSMGKVRPIIWDDELREMPEEDLLKAKLPSLVDIMVWKYTPNISISLEPAIWQKYAKLFKSVWAASSFKGATGIRQILTEPQHHIQNHFSWIETMAKYKDTIHFKGIAMTGWSRYDHFATLCELLPVAVPSLAVCLASLKNGGFNMDTHKITSKLLGCSNLIEMTFPEIDKKTMIAIVTQDCRFPGHMVYYSMQQLWGFRKQGQTEREDGYLSDYQMAHSFSNPGQLRVIFKKLSVQYSNFIQLTRPLQSELEGMYSNDTIEEWLDENIFEQERHIMEVKNKVKSLLQKDHWERRPLPNVIKNPIIHAMKKNAAPNSKSANSNMGIPQSLSNNAGINNARVNNTRVNNAVRNYNVGQFQDFAGLSGQSRLNSGQNSLNSQNAAPLPVKTKYDTSNLQNARSIAERNQILDNQNARNIPDEKLKAFERPGFLGSSKNVGVPHSNDITPEKEKVADTSTRSPSNLNVQNPALGVPLQESKPNAFNPVGGSPVQKKQEPNLWKSNTGIQSQLLTKKQKPLGAFEQEESKLLPGSRKDFLNILPQNKDNNENIESNGEADNVLERRDAMANSGAFGNQHRRNFEAVKGQINFLSGKDEDQSLRHDIAFSDSKPGSLHEADILKEETRINTVHSGDRNGMLFKPNVAIPSAKNKHGKGDVDNEELLVKEVNDEANRQKFGLDLLKRQRDNVMDEELRKEASHGNKDKQYPNEDLNPKFINALRNSQIKDGAEFDSVHKALFQNHDHHEEK